MATGSRRVVRARVSGIALESAALRTSLRRAVIALALATPRVAAGAEPVAFFPEAHLRLMGARYAPAERDFQWDAWIGGGVGFLRTRGVTFFGTADVETVIGNEQRAFDANQANYHLEAGLRIRAGNHLVIPFFHHVSRHLVDRPKTRLVDWNLVGVRATGPLPQALPLTGRYAASVGHTVEWRTVGYEWELTGVLDLDLLRRPWGSPYLRADVRFVTVKPQASFQRGDFADFLCEAGVRFGSGARNLDLFAAYEHRNDVFLLVPGARDRALFGIRFGFAPGGSAGPNLPIYWPGRTSR